MIEKLASESSDSVHPDGLVITEAFIKQRLGMRLAVLFPSFERNGAGIVSLGEELERICELCGYDNVIASLYFDEGKLSLGIFTREGSVPIRAVNTTDSDPPQVVPEIEG